MKIDLKLELRNVYGGDGNVRYEEVESVKLGRTKSRTTTKQELGIPIKTSVNEKIKEVQQKEVNTFEQNNGNPTLRIGGIHGKFWGLLKEAGILLSQIGDADFPSMAAVKRYMSVISIDPVYVELENGSKTKKVSLPQMLTGRSNSMITVDFDVIEKCNANISVVYPNVMHSKIIKMLEQAEKMACLNKRRAQIKITNLKEIKQLS